MRRDNDGWRVQAMPEPRPLYRLPDLADAAHVVLTEGEKAAEAARLLGYAATTSVGGAKAAAKTDFRPLAGKTVTILADNTRRMCGGFLEACAPQHDRARAQNLDARKHLRSAVR